MLEALVEFTGEYTPNISNNELVKFEFIVNKLIIIRKDGYKYLLYGRIAEIAYSSLGCMSNSIMAIKVMGISPSS